MSEQPTLVLIEGFGDLRNSIAKSVISQLGKYLKKFPNYSQRYFGDTSDLSVVHAFVDAYGQIHDGREMMAIYNCCRPNESASVFFRRGHSIEPYRLGLIDRVTYTPDDRADLKNFFDAF